MLTILISRVTQQFKRVPVCRYNGLLLFNPQNEPIVGFSAEWLTAMGVGGGSMFETA
jgi:hypothetical protein